MADPVEKSSVTNSGRVRILLVIIVIAAAGAGLWWRLTTGRIARIHPGSPRINRNFGT